MDVYCEDIDYVLLKPWNACIGSSLSPPSPSMWVGKEGQVSKLETVKPSCVTNTPWGGGGGLLGLIFAGYVLLASQNP